MDKGSSAVLRVTGLLAGKATNGCARQESGKTEQVLHVEFQAPDLPSPAWSHSQGRDGGNWQLQRGVLSGEAGVRMK